MHVRGWLIVGSENNLPQTQCVGETVGALPSAADFLPGQWMFWRPVPAVVADTPTMMAVVCVEIPI